MPTARIPVRPRGSVLVVVSLLWAVIATRPIKDHPKPAIGQACYAVCTHVTMLPQVPGHGIERRRGRACSERKVSPSAGSGFIVAPRSGGKTDGKRLGVGWVGRARIVHDDVAAVRRVANTIANGASADAKDGGARTGGIGMQNCCVGETAAS